MPKYVNRVPEMRKHKASGQAFVRVDDRYHYLGRYGTPEAREAYNRWVAEWLAKGRTSSAPVSGVTIGEVIAAYMVHAITYYRSATGESTGEAENMREALIPVRRLYESLPAAEFGVRKLDAVRATMVASGLSRKVVNARVNRIRRAFRWAASQELLPAQVVVELGMLAPLSKNRTAAPETRGIAPVPEAVVRQTLPHMPAAIAAMVELQLLTGCRASEVAAIRAEDVDRSVHPWEYRPGHHKTDYREFGRGRVVFFGPRAQAILTPFLERKGTGYVFDPQDAATRSKVRRKYDRRVYTQAIYRACDRAFPHPVISQIKTSRTVKLTAEQKGEVKEWRRKHRWSPLQLRHTAATRIRRDKGLEASQAVLGHARADVTQVYAERLDDLAREIAKSSG